MHCQLAVLKFPTRPVRNRFSVGDYRCNCYWCLDLLARDLAVHHVCWHPRCTLRSVNRNCSTKFTYGSLWNTRHNKIPSDTFRKKFWRKGARIRFHPLSFRFRVDRNARYIFPKTKYVIFLKSPLPILQSRFLDWKSASSSSNNNSCWQTYPTSIFNINHHLITI